MTNSSKMTLEEKIVQTLKDETLFKLVGDEDVITDLVSRAIKEALFQPRRIPKTYGGYDETDSVVVDAAREAAKAAADKAAEGYVNKLLENDEIRKIMMQTIAQQLPVAIHGTLSANLNNLMHNHTIEQTSRLRNDLLNKGMDISPY